MVKPVKKPVVTEEEETFRNEFYPDVKSVKNKNILCTSCNGSLKELILKGKPNTHPFMDTLLCEKCNSFFGDGEFSVDEDGSDKYCRWCGQGGTLYLCSTCTAGFCKKCIKRNLPRAALKEVEKDDWKCFCCDVKPLYELRAHCWAANKFADEFVRNKKKSKKSDEQDDHESDNSEKSDEPKKRSRLNDSDDEKGTRRSKRGKKQQPSDSKKVLKESNEKSKLYKPVVLKLKATIKDALSMTELFKKKALDCSSKKISVSYMKSLESVEEVSGKVDSLLQSVENISKELRSSVREYLDEWKKEQKEPGVKRIEKNNDEPADDLSDEKKTVNGIDEKNSSDKDRLEKDDTVGSDTSKTSVDLDESSVPDLTKVTVRNTKVTRSDDDDDDDENGSSDKEKETKDKEKKKSQKENKIDEKEKSNNDDNEEIDKKSDKSEDKKRPRDNSDDDDNDIPTEEEIHKKFKADSGDEEF